MARKVRKSVNAPDIQFKDPDLARLMQFVRAQANEIQRLQDAFAGGTLAQVLTKLSPSDYDATWQDAATGNITGAKNLGAGKPLFKDVEAGLIALRSLVQGDGITITQADTALTIAANIPPSGDGTVTSVGINSADLSVTGSPVSTSGLIELEINPKAVSYNKIQDTSTDAILIGRPMFSGPGSVAEVALSDVLDFLGGAEWGNILFRGTSGWQYLLPGTAGTVLTSHDVGADPTWSIPPGVAVHRGTGAPSTLYSDGDFYFDTSTSPYTGYTQVPTSTITPPVLTGTPNTAQWSTGAVGTVSITTPADATLLILQIGTELATAGSNPTVLSVAGGSLVFTKYTGETNGTTLVNGINTNQEIWTAPLSGALTGVTITVTMTASIDDGGLIAFATKNYDPVAIFHDGGSTGLPGADFTGSTAGVMQVTGITVDQGDLLLYFHANAVNNNGAVPATPSPFTGIATVNNTGGVHFMNLRAASLAVPSGGYAATTVTSASMPTGQPSLMNVIALKRTLVIGSAWQQFGTSSGSSPLTTKGDLFTHSTVDARLPVGADGLFLKADSTQTTGLVWAAAGGGGGGSAPVNPDTYPASPTAWDDEFETATLDTTGSRRTGANAWTLFSVGTNTQVQASGSLVLSQVAGGQAYNAITQPVPAGTWRFRAKLSMSIPSGSPVVGFLLYNTGNNKFSQLGIWSNGSGFVWFDQTGPLPGTSFGSTVSSANLQANVASPWNIWSYVEVEFTGTNIILRASMTGVSGSFQQIATEALSSWLVAIDRIGLHLNSNATGQNGVFDWFRRMA